jgi:hypothetical protein
MRKIFNTFLIIFLLSLFVLPLSSFAQGTGLVPCTDNCGFNDLLTLVNTFINFILTRLAVPIAAIMFAYAGFLLVFSGGESSKRTKAKDIFINVAIGLVFVAACWLIIHTISSIVGYDGSWIGL